MGAPGDSEGELLDGLERSSLSGRSLSLSGLGTWLGCLPGPARREGPGRGRGGTPGCLRSGSELGVKMERGPRLFHSYGPPWGQSLNASLSRFPHLGLPV